MLLAVPARLLLLLDDAADDVRPAARRRRPARDAERATPGRRSERRAGILGARPARRRLERRERAAARRRLRRGGGRGDVALRQRREGREAPAGTLGARRGRVLGGIVVVVGARAGARARRARRELVRHRELLVAARLRAAQLLERRALAPLTPLGALALVLPAERRILGGERRSERAPLGGCLARDERVQMRQGVGGCSVGPVVLCRRLSCEVSAGGGLAVVVGRRGARAVRRGRVAAKGG